MGPFEALRVEARVHYFHEHVTLHSNCVDTIEVAVGGLAWARSMHNDLVCIHIRLMGMHHGT